MIDINKKYKTRSGLPVTIKGKDDFNYCYGFIHKVNSNEIMIWNEYGKVFPHYLDKDLDLIEINEKQELIEEALRRYPKGTRFISIELKHLHISNGIIDDEHFDIYNNLYIDQYEIYNDGKWAEIVKEHTVEVTFGINAYGEVFALQSDAFDETPVAKKTITFYEGEGL